jgi:hypothetical protein
MKIQDLSKEMDQSAMAKVQGGGNNLGPPCTYMSTDAVGEAACAAQETWYQTFGFLLPK